MYPTDRGAAKVMQSIISPTPLSPANRRCSHTYRRKMQKTKQDGSRTSLAPSAPSPCTAACHLQPGSCRLAKMQWPAPQNSCRCLGPRSQPDNLSHILTNAAARQNCPANQRLRRGTRDQKPLRIRHPCWTPPLPNHQNCNAPLTQHAYSQSARERAHALQLPHVCQRPAVGEAHAP